MAKRIDNIKPWIHRQVHRMLCVCVCTEEEKNDSAQGSKNNIRWKYSLKGVQSIIIICFVSIRNIFWPNTTSIIVLFFRSFCLSVFSCPFFFLFFFFCFICCHWSNYQQCSFMPFVLCSWLLHGVICYVVVFFFST